MALGRRRFMAATAGGLLAAPFAAIAQPAGKIYCVGLIFFSSDFTSPVVRVWFRIAMRDLGYIEVRILCWNSGTLRGGRSGP